MADRDPLVVFTPSGKRGRFPVGTPLLSAARTLGVDVDSVCGGRGICGRCQVLIAEGEFAKHGVRSGAASVSAGQRDRSSATRKRARPAGRASAVLLDARRRATSSSTCRPAARSTARSCARTPTRARSS